MPPRYWIVVRRSRRALRASGWFLAVMVLVARAAAAPHFASDTELIDRVVALIDRRLALMPEIAATKFEQHKSIADPAREREVLENSVADARALQLDAEAARAFFDVQIRMARAVQEHCFERWRRGGEPPKPARDLAKELRPELDALGRELLPAVYLASPALADMPVAALRTRLSRIRHYGGVTDEHLAGLARALVASRLTATPTWATVRRVGVLRVGTTGDYAPFSDDRGGTLQGFDIELVQGLANAWGVAVLFVRTTWPTLMADLSARRFDLAASGVSVTDERRRTAEFSIPYYFDGKTPIARREDAARFASLEGIDQPGVRVVVNPGGTNERFVREHLRRATIVVHADNRTIFEEIGARRADVMITDGIEVRLQERRHPELAGTRAEPFTRTGKALLLPRGSELTGRVDDWLAAESAQGRTASLLAEALDVAGGHQVQSR